MDVAVLLGCAAPTGMGAVYNVLKVQRRRRGRRVRHRRHRAECADGGGALAGAMPVIGIDPNPTRRALAKIYGATHVIDPVEAPTCWPRSGRSCHKGLIWRWNPPACPAVMEQAINATRQQGGRAVVIGNARHGATLSLNPAVFNQGKSLLGTWGGDSFSGPRLWPLSAACWLRSLSGARSAVEALQRSQQADQALQDLAAGKVGRPLIDMSLR